ncbi:hypothetical protein [Pontibacter anaerobius]|uniref:Outer membrane lipoprotein-sorting protein n=1 Tax=Pontibacter anaerobius TaxID=2993940 RepID=A0ABT3RDV9_9BACT|nr:hypothetical protein [Pontibacter anaerobius]MCX2739611.1 hypothetical protein [Pontibacter anaerobius]
MKKHILLLLFLLCYTCAQSQSSDASTKGAAARARMLNAFGGEQLIREATHFSYTLTRSTPGGTSSSATYVLDLQNRFITTTTQTPAGTEMKSIDASGAWQSINGQRKPLPEQGQEVLLRTFFFNFIPMLQNKQLQFVYLRSDKYKTRWVDVVRVSDPHSKTLVLDLFIDQENGQVLTSSREDENGQYLYFADELEYEPVGGGYTFPLVFQIVKDGKVTSEGRFEEVWMGK